jgi:Cdc6-like AAA superfamily ATPase
MDLAAESGNADSALELLLLAAEYAYFAKLSQVTPEDVKQARSAL